jgi:hypothetical protein
MEAGAMIVAAVFAFFGFLCLACGIWQGDREMQQGGITWLIIAVVWAGLSQGLWALLGALGVVLAHLWLGAQ